MSAHRSEGQALPLFALGLIVFLGFVAMSIDVGRYVWARTQMQAAVDAAALAGAQSMPNTAAADSYAQSYWLDNSGFIQSQGSNVQFAVTYPAGGVKAVHVHGEANISTWFARLFGVNEWFVEADAQAEARVVDAVLVLDRSGSMCWDSHGPNGNYVSQVRTASWIDATQTSFAVTKNPSVALTPLDQLLGIGQVFRVEGSSSTEWMRITAIDNVTDTITVDRAVPSAQNGQVYPASSHNAGRHIRGSNCSSAGPGPYYPWEQVAAGGQIFVGEFNPGYDRIGFAHFSTRGELDTALTSNLSGLQTAIGNAPDPTTLPNGDGRTNIAHGFYLANEELIASARANATKVVVLLSDGVANTYCSPVTATQTCPSTSTGNSTASARALEQADHAAANGIVVYTIGYGNASDDALMQEIADRTGGKFYKTPDAAALQAAFIAIAEDTKIALTQ